MLYVRVYGMHNTNSAKMKPASKLVTYCSIVPRIVLVKGDVATAQKTSHPITILNLGGFHDPSPYMELNSLEEGNLFRIIVEDLVGRRQHGDPVAQLAQAVKEAVGARAHECVGERSQTQASAQLDDALGLRLYFLHFFFFCRFQFAIIFRKEHLV